MQTSPRIPSLKWFLLFLGGIVFLTLALTIAAVRVEASAATANALSGHSVPQRVIRCYNAATARGKTVTIEEMFACSGVWVTPRGLLRCALETHCPVLPDTVEGRATLDATLQAERLTRRSVLMLRPRDLPPMPNATTIGRCRKDSKTEEAFQNCVMSTITGAKYANLRSCFSGSTEGERVACFAKQVNDLRFAALLSCMGGEPPSPDKLVQCSEKPEIKSQLQKMQECVTAVSTIELARSCLTDRLSQEQKDLAQCVSNSRTNSEAAACLDRLSRAMAKARGVTGCLSTDNSSPIACGADVVGGKSGQTMKCLADAKDSITKKACLSAVNPEIQRALHVTECIDRRPRGDALKTCVAPYLGRDAARFSSCVSDPKAAPESCFVGLNPKIKEAHRALACLSDAKNDVEGFNCVAGQVRGDAPRIAACISNPDRKAVPFCLLGDKPEVRAAQRVYTCVSSGRDAASLIANCTEGVVDGKTAQTLACAASSGSDRSKLASCAAGAVLPPQAARLVGCASSSQGPTSFALCAAGPAMNEEWRIAAECAVQSGGNPVGFAGCTAGRLTVRELTKCFTGEIGKDCFGPNNSIVKGLSDAFEDLTHGPGENNEVVKAIRVVGELTGGPNSVINNPGQLAGGSNSMINNPGQIWGGKGSVFHDPGQVFDPGRWRF
jgi:hypothetical protein